MAGGSGYRVHLDAEYAALLVELTYRARIRYWLAGTRSAGKTLSADRGAARYSALNPRPSELKRSKSEFFPLTPREGILNSAVCEVHLGVLEDTFLEQSFYHLLVHILSD